MALQLAEAFISINVPTQGVASAFNNIKATVNQNVQQIAGNFTQIINKYSSATNAAVAGTQTLVGAMGAAAIQMIAAQKGVEALSGAIRESIKFNQNLTKSQSILDSVSARQSDQMRELAIVLSTETGQSAAELAAAFYALGQAGFTLEDQLNALPVAARFAIAADADLQKSTELLSQVQAALGLKFRYMSDESRQAAMNLTNMQRVADLMAKASVLAQGSINDFSEALANKGAAAIQKYGLTVEEGVAGLVAFAEIGITGQRAGTAFERTLRVLTENAIRLGPAFEKLGISPFDKATGQLRDFAGLMRNIHLLFKDLSDESKVELEKELFPQRGGAGFLTALARSSGSIEQWVEELENAAGTSDGIFAKAMKSNENTLKRMRQEVRSLGLEIGDRLVNAFVFLARPITYIANVLGTLDRITGHFVSRFMVLVGALEVGTLVWGTLAKTAGGFLARAGFSQITVWIATLLDKIGLIGPATRAVTAEFHDFLKSIPLIGGALSGLARLITVPINIIGTAAGVGLGLAISQSLHKAFVGAINKVFTADVKAALEKAFPQLEHFAKQVGEIFARAVEAIVTLSANMWLFIARKLKFDVGFEGFVKGLPAAIAVLGDFVSAVGDLLIVLLDNWETTWDLIVASVDLAAHKMFSILGRFALQVTFILSGIAKEFGKVPVFGRPYDALSRGLTGDKMDPSPILASSANDLMAGLASRSNDELIKIFKNVGEAYGQSPAGTTMQALVAAEVKTRELSKKQTEAMQKLIEQFNIQRVQTEVDMAVEAQQQEKQEKFNAKTEAGDKGPLFSSMFSGFAELGKQIQEQVGGDDKLGSIIGKLGDQLKQGEETNGLLKGIKDGQDTRPTADAHSPPVASGKMTVTTSGPGVPMVGATRALQGVPMPPANRQPRGLMRHMFPEPQKP